MNRCLAAVALCIALAAAPSSVRAEQYEKADIYVELRGIALSLAQDQRGIEPAAGLRASSRSPTVEPACISAPAP
jgi:hypothetical protein